MLQFKQRIEREFQPQESGMIAKNLSHDDVEHFISLPVECPRSSIVYGENCGDYKTMARELYLKYVKDDSPYEINVDYGTRKGFDLLDDEEKWKENTEYDDDKKL